MKTTGISIRTLRRRLQQVRPTFPDRSWSVAAAFARVVGVLKNNEFILTKPKAKSNTQCKHCKR